MIRTTRKKKSLPILGTEIQAVSTQRAKCSRQPKTALTAFEYVPRFNYKVVLQGTLLLQFKRETFHDFVTSLDKRNTILKAYLLTIISIKLSYADIFQFENSMIEVFIIKILAI